MTEQKIENLCQTLVFQFFDVDGIFAHNERVNHIGHQRMNIKVLQYFIKLVILNKIHQNDVEIYDENDYIKYILNDVNEMRKKFKIPERNINQTFSLFSAEDFITEYKSM